VKYRTISSAQRAARAKAPLARNGAFALGIAVGFSPKPLR
jgi:hypothetical protein